MASYCILFYSIASSDSAIQDEEFIYDLYYMHEQEFGSQMYVRCFSTFLPSIILMFRANYGSYSKI